MKVVVINGSPQVKGNTSLAIDRYLTAFSKKADIKRYDLIKLKYSGCIACKSCYKTGECIFKDDITPLYHDYNTADVLIVATPIYFLSVSSYLKAVIDRTQSIWSSKYILKQSTIDRNKKRVGIFLATAGASLSNNANLAARTVIDMYFKAVNTEYKEEVIIYNTDSVSLAENNEKQQFLVSQGDHMFKYCCDNFA